MVVSAADPRQMLPFPQGEGLFADIQHLQMALVALQSSAEITLPNLGLVADLSSLRSLSTEIYAATTLDTQLRLYQHKYQPLAIQLKQKYHHYLDSEQWQAIAEYESYVEAIAQLKNIEDSICKAFSHKLDSEARYTQMYDSMICLTKLLDQYVSYFYPGLIKNLKELMLQILDDTDFEGDRSQYNGNKLPCSISAKNSAKLVLWQLENLDRTAPSREIQIQKNRPAMEWMKQRMDFLKAEISARR
ncbi:MAG: hypothetical protein ACPGVO_23360 [Spirulinaceae cyanobacterium]